MAVEDARKLFVAGLPDSVTEEVLRSLFSETGATIVEVTVPKDRMTGRPRGFAIIRLGSPEEADRGRQDLDGRIVDGRMISVRPFQTEPPGGRGPRAEGERPPRREFGGGGGGGPGAGADRTLYVGNLPYDATQEEVETLLREAGVQEVQKVYLPVDQDGRKRGFGFVTLGTPEAANASLEPLRNVAMRGRKLIVNIAHPKGDRPPRPEGGAGGGPPRSFGGGGGASPPMQPPPSRSGKGDGRRRRFEGGGEGGGEGRPGGARNKRDREERWRGRDDDDDY